MGPVVKVVLSFRSVFWEDGFVQLPPESPFPTLWSRMPQPAPVLAAWAGGDAVRRLYARCADPLGAAIDACSAAFPAADVRAQLQAAYFHDWPRVRLAQPLADVVFFAGEATSIDYAGTVSGALESGLRAADTL